MASEQELRAVRQEKMEKLRQAGMNPYPSRVPKSIPFAELREKFGAFEKKKKKVSGTGRILSIRGQGAIMFATLDDGSDKFQAVFKADSIKEKDYALFQEAIDIGDFINIAGTLFTTQKGEPSILVNSWTIASKALLPLPEKWHGLTDPDERLRKRYLDFATTPELRGLFYRKTKFWEVTRNFLKKKGFLEVDTPTLEVTTGGAEANPFKTHHDDFDMDVFLRISVGELWQKRLMAGGFPKTFEIGRVYRNEGTSTEHLQEFTNMEFYWSYADYSDGMQLVEKLYQEIALKVYGKTQFTARGHTFDFKGKWPRIDYRNRVLEVTGIDVLTATENVMKEKLAELRVEYTGATRERLIDTLWKYCRKDISGPAFLINHPKLVSPLAKAKKDNPELTERFQVMIAGSEVGNGFSELNDPIDQRTRFELQQKLIDRGDTEAMMPDWEFVEMLEHGMPPTCGFGFGERLFAILEDKPIRETQLFPLVRPKS